jgi:DNA-binding IclR family transcriptional regulator
MAVKRNQSAARALTLLETIAAHQPIGVRALATLLNEDKSAVHRILLTLVDHGWIRAASEPPVRWEMTAHILAVAYAAHGNNDLRRRARPALERLRDQTDETVSLILPNVRNFVIADVIESRQILRMVPHVGTVVSARDTATGRAVLPFLEHDQQVALLGAQPGERLLDSYAQTRAQGYAVSGGETNPAATNVAAAVFDFAERPVAVIVLSGPRERLAAPVHHRIGALVARTARELSWRPT